MSIFTYWPQQVRLMLSKPSSLKKVVSHASGWGMCMKNVIKIHHVIQELWAFSLTDHGGTDSHSAYSADPRLVLSPKTYFNPLCTNGFFLLARYNELGMVYCIYQGITCYKGDVLLKGTATLMITKIYMEDLNKPCILIPVSSKSVEKYGSCGRLSICNWTVIEAAIL